MIRAARILQKNKEGTPNWAYELAALKNRKFKFKPGLNVLFGPNGCGKTTLLKVLGAYCGCPSRMGGGWSCWPRPLDLREGYDHDADKVVFPQRFRTLAPCNTEAAVDWDGVATYMHLADGCDAPIQNFETKHPLMDSTEHLRVTYGGPSSGQQRFAMITKLVKAVENPPDLTVVDKDNVRNNEAWTGAEERFRSYVETLPRDGLVTILMDEPGRSLDIPIQVLFWKNVLPKIAKTHQVIVATHSAPALWADDVNMIDMVPGYAETSRRLLDASRDKTALPVDLLPEWTRK